MRQAGAGARARAEMIDHLFHRQYEIMGRLNVTGNWAEFVFILKALVRYDKYGEPERGGPNVFTARGLE